LLLFITLFIIFFYVIIIIVVIVIKITPDFCHKYRNDMQFPNFWVKIFFFNFLKNVILQFGPFLLSMPHISFISIFILVLVTLLIREIGHEILYYFYL